MQEWKVGVMDRQLRTIDMHSLSIIGRFSSTIPSCYFLAVSVWFWGVTITTNSACPSQNLTGIKVRLACNICSQYFPVVYGSQTIPIPYSAKFSQVFNFANFTSFRLFAKVFQRKFLTCKLQFSRERASMDNIPGPCCRIRKGLECGRRCGQCVL